MFTRQHNILSKLYVAIRNFFHCTNFNDILLLFNFVLINVGPKSLKLVQVYLRPVGRLDQDG